MSTQGSVSLSGKHILVLEDEPLIALDIERILRDAGASLVDLCMAMDAEPLGRIDAFDAAVVDLRIRGKSSLPIIRALREHFVPFIVVTGQCATGGDELFREVPCLEKPFSEEDLLARLCGETARVTRERI